MDVALLILATSRSEQVNRAEASYASIVNNNGCCVADCRDTLPKGGGWS